MVQVNTMPGYCKTSSNIKIERRRMEDILKFTGDNKNACYIGESGILNFNAEYILAKDFNFDRLIGGKYDAVYCFEILEHLQNPLWFMKQLKGLMKEEGSIFLSTPYRPKLIWPSYHYNEISPKHFQKWLLDPLGLKIIRKKKLYINQGWITYFIGLRPLIRAIKTLNFKPIILSLTNTTWIYEIK